MGMGGVVMRERCNGGASIVKHLAQAIPFLLLISKGAGVSGTAGWQRDGGDVARFIKLPRANGRSPLAIKGNELEVRQSSDQSGEIIGRDIADGGIQTAMPFRRRHHIPERNLALYQRGEPAFIIKASQIPTQHAAHQPPKLILRMRIITRRCQRRLSRQTTEHKQPRIGAIDGGEGSFAGHLVFDVALKNTELHILMNESCPYDMGKFGDYAWS